MSVSKRLRFEILRRDNHQCRYCGATAPDVKLAVDHVVPVALGGGDEPSNLVAACVDCNSGKSSASPDASIVENVSADALRWSKAMEMVAHTRAIIREEANERYGAFLAKWNTWTYTYMGQKKTVDLPSGWEQSVDQFLTAGLEMGDLHELIDVAMSLKYCKNEWRYFCGCCWQRIKQSHEAARAVVELWEREGDEQWEQDDDG